MELKYYDNNFAVTIPMANEEADFEPFITSLREVFDKLGTGTAYLIVDKVSKDRTLELCRKLEQEDPRFVTIWAPENRNVVDAYLRGLKEAYLKGHDIIIEMDAGLSHDPRAIIMFIRVLNEGNECAFGSRFINGGSMVDSPLFRRLLSKNGTRLTNLLLGTKMYDMTSGFQGFHRSVVEKIIQYPFRSKAHYYQTEMRYLLRKKRYREIPIHYRAPSRSVSHKAIFNALSVLFYYFIKRITFKAVSL
ncbi:MAG: glycosyltransferase [Sphingobacteriales bacterium]|nr:glycosyltransferase [Sphingobacteriales bacterium]